MSDQMPPATSREDLLAKIDDGWNELQAFIDSINPDRLTELADAAGWAAKDHIAHLAAWENSMVFLLQGKPRHEGLGVPETTYLDGDSEVINDAIFQQIRHEPLGTVLQRFQRVHAELLSLLRTLTDADLQQPYAHFLPDEPGRDDGSPIIGRLSGNTHWHYAEHLEWIERIVTHA